MKVRSILNAVFIVFTLTASIIFIKIEFDKCDNNQDKNIPYALNLDYEARLNWPEERAFVIDLNTIHNDPYIYIEFSNADTYAVEFINTIKDHSHTVVMNTKEWAWYYFDKEFKQIMHLIPSYIVEDGYDRLHA